MTSGSTDITFHYPPELFNLLVDVIPLLNRSKQDVLVFFRGAGVSEAMTVDLGTRLRDAPKGINKYEIVRTVLPGEVFIVPSNGLTLVEAIGYGLVRIDLPELFIHLLHRLLALGGWDRVVRGQARLRATGVAGAVDAAGERRRLMWTAAMKNRAPA